MKLIKIFGLIIVGCMLPGISRAQAASLTNSSSIEIQESASNIVNRRSAELTRGINLSHWFAQSPNSGDPDYLQGYVTDVDFKLIKNLGFEHVRLPIDPTLLFNENDPKTLNSQYLGYLDSALDKIQANGLSAIVDLHPEMEFKQRLAGDDAFSTNVAQFWGALAEHLSSRDPEQVFLEAINEPAFGVLLSGNPTINPKERWNQVQGELLAAMRRGAPNHTLIVSGDNFSSIEDLLAQTPVQDPNVVYNFHFYNSFLFTHQGADFAGEEVALLHDLPYPFNSQTCATVIPTIDESARAFAQSYCDEQWDAAKIEGQIAAAAAWAKQNNVILTANEFGVYSAGFVRPEDRNAWITDVRSLLEKYEIGWSMWNYKNDFGLVTQQDDGKLIVNGATLQALGLSSSTQSVPEPSAIAGLALITLVGIVVKRRSCA